MITLSAVALLLSTPAHAGLGDRTAGAYADVSGGLAADYGLHVGVASELGVGAWIGKYDDAFAIGRAWSFGARGHADWTWQSGALTPRIATTLEFHRVIDLLVVGLRFGAQAGPTWRLPRLASCDGDVCTAPPAFDGAAALADASVVYRFHRHWGLSLKAEAGVDIGVTTAPVVPVGSVLLGIAFEAPGKHKTAAATPVADPIDPDWPADPAPSP